MLVGLNIRPEPMKMIKERADILAIFLGDKEDMNTNAYC